MGLFSIFSKSISDIEDDIASRQKRMENNKEKLAKQKENKKKDKNFHDNIPHYQDLIALDKKHISELKEKLKKAKSK